MAPAKDRHWGVFSIFNIWTSDMHSLWGSWLAASLFLLCGTFLNFIIAIGLRSLIFFALMSLVGYAGEKTGVPYPVLARASSGAWAPILRRWCAPSWLASGTARRPPRRSTCASRRGFLF